MNDKAPHTPEASDSILGRTVQRLDPAHGPRPHHRSPLVGGHEQGGRRVASQAAARMQVEAAQTAAVPEAASSEASPADSSRHRESANASHSSAGHLGGLERRLRQAAELADFLKQRMTDLDRREAQLNAREAAVEQRERMTQLWAEEKTREINETRSELHTEIHEFSAERHRFQESQIVWRKRHEEAEAELLARSQRLGRDRAAFEAMCRQVQREQDATRLRIQSAERRIAEREQEKQHDLAKLSDEKARLKKACAVLIEHSKQFRREATDVIELRQQLAARLAKLQDYLDYRLEQLEQQRETHDRQVRLRHTGLDARERDVNAQLQRMIQERTELMTEKLAVHQLWTKICSERERPLAAQKLAFLRMQVHDQFQRQYQELRALLHRIERERQQVRWERDQLALQRGPDRAAAA